MADAKTDISDRSFEELLDDEEAVKELGTEYDTIDGRWATEKILTRIFVLKGRADDVPDEYSEYLQTDEAREDNGDEAGGTETHTAEKTSDTALEDDRDTSDESEGETGGRDKKLGATNGGAPGDAKFIIDADRIQTWIEYIDVLVDEAKVHINQDGLAVRAVDPANVGMVDTHLYDTAFESYTTSGGAGLIGVNTERFAGIVGEPNAGELVEIEHVAETRNLVIRFGGHEFTISLIDPDSIRTEPDLPDLNLAVEADFEAARTVHGAIGYADDVSDHVSFRAFEDGERYFGIHAEGDTDTYDGAFEDGEEVSFRAFDRVESLFSLDYLKDMRKAWQKDVELTFELGNEFPVKIHQEIRDDDDPALELGQATYMLAPRIQSD